MGKACYGLVALLLVPMAVLLGAQGLKKLKPPRDEAESQPAKPNKIKLPKAEASPDLEAEALKAAEKAGKHIAKLDRNGDSVLDADELPAKWRESALAFDRDGDGKLNEEELGAYLADAEVAKKINKLAGKAAKGKKGDPPPAETAPPPPARPVVYRAGRLPAGLPGWFAQLDTDGDGQVGLYEWKAAGRDVDEYLKMDLNEDGFVTAEEVLRVEKPRR